VKTTCIYAASIILSWIGLAIACFAQPTAAHLQGTITALYGTLPERLTVEVIHDRVAIARTTVDSDNSFDVFGFAPGRYELRVVDSSGSVLHTEHTEIPPHLSRIELRMAGERKQASPNGTVSLRSLMKPPSKSVLKELDRADKAWAKRNAEKSFEHLNRALAECPDCAEVHINLGSRYMRMSRVDEALSAFTKAVRLDPDSVIAQSNLAIALVTLRRYDEAERAAKRALSLDPAAVSAGYALGIIALSRKQCSLEAISYIRRAAEKYPRAHLPAAMLFECRGERKEAVSELTAYLDKPEAEQRESVERWRSGLLKQISD